MTSTTSTEEPDDSDGLTVESDESNSDSQNSGPDEPLNVQESSKQERENVSAGDIPLSVSDDPASSPLHTGPIGHYMPVALP